MRPMLYGKSTFGSELCLTPHAYNFANKMSYEFLNNSFLSDFEVFAVLREIGIVATHSLSNSATLCPTNFNNNNYNNNNV